MRQRMIKDAEELKLIKAAVQLGAKVYLEALESLRPGVSEMEVAAKLEYAARRGGADGDVVRNHRRGRQARRAATWSRQSARPFPRADSWSSIRVLYCAVIVLT